MAKATARREILCPRCDTPFEVSAKTQSTMCPGCNRTIKTGDETIKEYCARQEVFTEGTVEVARKGHVIAEVRVRSLVVAGEVKGAVRARDSVEIEKTGKVFGDVTTPSLVVKDGAALVDYCRIGRFQEPAPETSPVNSASASK